MFPVRLEVGVKYFLDEIRASKSRAMAQEVSRRPFPEETVVRSRASSREICGGQSGTGTGFAPSMYFGFPPSVAFQRLYILIFMLMLLLPEGQAGEAWQPSNKAMLFQIFESIGQKSTFTLFVF